MAATISPVFIKAWHLRDRVNGRQSGFVLLETAVQELTEAETLEPGLPEPAALRLQARA